ncbi:hypothetical protein F5884DRAFT_360650 [Xylogone sp. PMI_703]|nr:hypothetical protein F5884DRAFT_360650 [Xylogone sp. PMI_703]
MDLIQDSAMMAYQFYANLQPYLVPVLSNLSELQKRLYPVLLPYLNQLAVLAQDSPAVVSFGALLLLLIIAIQIINFVHRIIMFWTKLIMRLFFWTAVAIIVAMVWQRGLARTVDDVSQWGDELKTVWWQEYRKWEGYQNQMQMARTNSNTNWR